MAYIGTKPTAGNFQICDAISVVNGQAAYTMQVGSVNVIPQSANHMIVSLNGVIQKPGSSFTVSGSTITFASNLATGDAIDFIQILGDVLDLGTPSDATVTAAKLNNDIISGQTELAVAPASTDELLISDNGTLKRVDYSYLKAANTPNFFAFVNANQTVNHNTDTKVGFNTESFDTASAYDHSSNFRFTVPSGQGGKYSLTAQILLYDANAQLQGIRPKIFKNGSLVSEALWDKETGGSKYWYNYSSNINILLNLSASDYIEIYVRGYTTDSGTFVVNGHSSEIYSYFTGYKIIE